MNYTRSDQISIIKSITLKEGDSKTLDCPFCGGRKKFTISKIDGRVIWNCYRASCTSRGVYNSGRSLTAIKNKLNGTNNRTLKRTTEIPAILSDVDNHPNAVEYLQSVNAYESYKNGLINIKYAPAYNRVLYFNHYNNGAVGRALDDRKPKWMTYGDTDQGIKVGVGKTAVLVEDVASACSVARLPNVTGYALLGTNITTSIKSQLKSFTKCIIVLDLDASSKALRLAKAIQSYTDVRVRLTKQDLKWLSPDQISNIINTG